MKKTLLTKAALERAALVEIRALHGCECVTELIIHHSPDPSGVSNWTIATVSRTGVDPAADERTHRDVARGVAATQKKLREIYDLSLD
ncbi:hypothetical protein SAMN03159423_0478 [Bradyrhizobium sp. NFR13]|uniref:hypothetical protein n=1 Tax=Bradyrhizobium sp. NFR13 TaxID=1566285 RepID=UPI0008E4645D|nr:hypothetical protein [Bradyrhizobium sp. NFR13]SFM29649.1 hypothetical protein SAMN03159423_0478 [Bradyrhizobium sp. NFR13]